MGPVCVKPLLVPWHHCEAMRILHGEGTTINTTVEFRKLPDVPLWDRRVFQDTFLTYLELLKPNLCMLGCMLYAFPAVSGGGGGDRQSGSDPKCRGLHILRVSCLWAVSVCDTEPERHRGPRDIARQPALILGWI